MGQSLKQATNTEIQATACIRSIYRTARLLGYSQEWIKNAFDKLYEGLPKSFSLERRSRLIAIKQVLYQEMMERDIEHLYLFKDFIYSVNVNTKHHLSTKGLDARELYENSKWAFWWIEANKPFTEWRND